MTSNETPPEPVQPELVAAVGAHLKAALENPDTPLSSEAIVAMVFDGTNQVNGGDDLGTARKDPVTGIWYIRVNCGGVHRWRVVDPNDGDANAYDTRKLTYPVIDAPTEATQ